MRASDVRTVRMLPQLSRYRVTASGLVLHYDAGCGAWVPVWQRTNDEGYTKVKLTMDNGRRREFFVHRLVALAFLPTPGPGQTLVRHRDDDRANNAAENLRWGTHADNHQDKVENGRLAPVRRKLVPDDVRRIRRSPLSAPRLAKKLGLSISHVREIKNGRKWARLA